MPEISRFFGIIIRMYFADHNPPHFHASYQGFMAEYDIRTLEVINGSLPQRAHAMVIEWASLHRNELLNNWEKARKPEALDQIEPLS